MSRGRGFGFPKGCPSAVGIICQFPKTDYSVQVRSIYFDHNATTPLDPEVREAMLPYWGEIYGNPSSVHHVGRLARAALDDARDRVAHVFGCKPSEIVFTSGGTESINLAVLGAARLRRMQGRHIVTSSTEHHAVLHACEYLQRKEGFNISYLPVDAEGRVDLPRRHALRPGARTRDRRRPRRHGGRARRHRGGGP